MSETILLEEGENALHGLALCLTVSTKQIIVHTDVHGAADGIILEAARVIATEWSAERLAFVGAVIWIETCDRMRGNAQLTACRWRCLCPEVCTFLVPASPHLSEGWQLIRRVGIEMGIIGRHEGNDVRCRVI